MPRDETETEEDPFADDGSGSEHDGREEGGDGPPVKLNVMLITAVGVFTTRGTIGLLELSIRKMWPISTSHQ